MLPTLNVPLLILSVAAIMLLVEWRKPAWRRALCGNWWLRAALLNGAQAGVAWLGVTSWDAWFAATARADSWTAGTLPGIATGYLLITFIYYWWHRARHSVPLLWRYVHRLHHSPARIEVITSFYKHPVELLLNAVLSSALLYFVLGLDAFSVSITVLLTGAAELFYHWNVRTPRWLGWFFQRPEMHRVHHERGKHTSNFSDLPLWDALFGTLNNPEQDIEKCGFPEEQRLLALLLGRPVKEV